MNLANGYAVNLTDVSPKIDDRPADRRPLTTDRKGGNIFSAVRERRSTVGNIDIRAK